jgi:Flp pilus assembly pilin Flp
MIKKLVTLLKSENGQSTTEYALLILAVVAIAGLIGTVGVKGMSQFITKIFAKLVESVQ